MGEQGGEDRAEVGSATLPGHLMKYEQKFREASVRWRSPRVTLMNQSYVIHTFMYTHLLEIFFGKCPSLVVSHHEKRTNEILLLFPFCTGENRGSEQ